MAMSNDELSKLLKNIEDEVSRVKAMHEHVQIEPIAESDLSKWSDWNNYVQDMQNMQDDYSLTTGAYKQTLKEDGMNYNYDFDPPSYTSGATGAWTSRVEEYIKADGLDAKPISKNSPLREKVEKIKRTRFPSYKKDDRVNTPKGSGSVWSVDRDGTVCVVLDNDDPSILHEFEKKEIKKAK